MQIKRFEAKTMAEAFKYIKQEFGPDAVILSAKTIHKDKGLFDRGKSTMVEVLAANDSYVIQQEKKNHNQNIIQSYANNMNNLPSDMVSLGTNKKENTGKKMNLLKSFRISKNNIDEDNEEIENYYNYKKLLINKGITEDIAEEIVERSRTIHQTKDQGTKKSITSYLSQVLFDMGVRNTSEKKDYNKQNIISLIGLTGIGKTTTLAKLAATEIIEMHRTVGVISLDNYRVGSNALLKVFSNIIGFPVQFISSVKEIKQALKQYGDKDIIMVDTPGIGLNDFQMKNNIRELIEKIKPDETHLLMHANMKHADARQVRDSFEIFDYNRMLFTKIDETTSFGAMINQLVETGKPISYVTMGQNVPEDISEITLKGLSKLLLNDKENEETASIDPAKIKAFPPKSMFHRAVFH